jgi:hypothetical protein
VVAEQRACRVFEIGPGSDARQNDVEARNECVVAAENLGPAGDGLENGDGYRPEEVRAMAAQLLRERKQA